MGLKSSGQWPVVSGQFLELALSSGWKRFLMFQRKFGDGRRSTALVPCGFLAKISSNEAGGFGTRLRAFRNRIGVSPSPLPSLESSR